MINYKDHAFDKIVDRTNYIIGTHNLWKKDGQVLYDQMSYKDYPPRSIYITIMMSYDEPRIHTCSQIDIKNRLIDECVIQ